MLEKEQKFILVNKQDDNNVIDLESKDIIDAYEEAIENLGYEVKIVSNKND